MNFVKTCYFFLFILSIHSARSASYKETLRIKRLTQQSTETSLDEATVTTSPVDTGSTTTKENLIVSTSPPNRKSKKIDSVNFKSNAVSQIPVQVIYDPQPETPIGQNSTTTKTPRNGQRNRKIRRRKPFYQSKQFLNSQKSTDDIKQSTTSTTVKTIDNTASTKVKDTKNTELISTRTVEKSTTTPKTKQSRGRYTVIPIIDSESQVYSHKGEFHYSYESGDGTKAFERSEDKKVDVNGPSNGAVVGGFSYTDKDGNDFSLSYTADENGYRPSGDHLPTAPPIPPAIARALKYLATKPTPDPDSVTSKYLLDY